MKNAQGKLKCRHVIPLHRSRTQLSIYNQSEPILCLTLPSSLHTEALPGRRSPRRVLSDHLRDAGTSIFLLRPRIPSLAADWCFDIWQELGGELPAELPREATGNSDARLVLPIPEHASDAKQWNGPTELVTGQGFKLMTAERIIDKCTQLIDQVGDWHQLHLERGGSDLELALAWRNGNRIEWVVDDTTPEGTSRDAQVMAGHAYDQVRWHLSM